MNAMLEIQDVMNKYPAMTYRLAADGTRLPVPISHVLAMAHANVMIRDRLAWQHAKRREAQGVGMVPELWVEPHVEKGLPLPADQRPSWPGRPSRPFIATLADPDRLYDWSLVVEDREPPP